MQYVEILIAGAGVFLLGFAWYTALFGKIWQAETGITAEQAQQNMAIRHGTAFLMMLVMAYGISFIVHLHKPEDQTFLHGAFHGAMMAGLFALPAIAINYAYQRKSLKLYLIDAGYLLSFSALIGI
jgi:hypothetical protein